jgi:hypothetical protein
MPGPKLILDAEGGSRFTPSKKKIWDPMMCEPPIDDGSWDTCIVYVKDYQAVTRAYEWLASGAHPFKSVGLDSISEIQQRCVDSLVGINQMKIQDWGALLRQVSDLIRKFRDLTTHPTHPLQAVVLIAMTRQVDGKWRPHVQGQLAVVLPYYVDVTGYIFIVNDDGGKPIRRLLVTPHDQYEAGERVGGKLGSVVDAPNVSTMLDMIYGPEGQSA